MPPRSVADLVSDLRHGGSLAGASAVGQAAGGERLAVQVAIWRSRAGAVERARFRATTCAALLAYAEAACALLEAGEPPLDLGPARLARAVAGAHPLHHDRAELVALAVARAVARRPPPAAGASSP